MALLVKLMGVKSAIEVRIGENCLKGAAQGLVRGSKYSTNDPATLTIR